MTNKQANSKVVKLFNKWQRDFKSTERATNQYFEDLADFEEECRQVHDIVGLYEVISDKNALKMASICSSIRFVAPFRMLMQLQHVTKSY